MHLLCAWDAPRRTAQDGPRVRPAPRQACPAPPRPTPTHPNPNQECPNGEGISGLKVFRGFIEWGDKDLYEYDLNCKSIAANLASVRPPYVCTYMYMLYVRTCVCITPRLCTCWRLCAGGCKPMCWRLQAYVLEAASLCAGGCKPMCHRCAGCPT